MNFLLDGLINADSVAGIAGAAYDSAKSIIDIVLPVVLGVVLLVGIIYSVKLGLNYAKAEEAQKRDAAKQHLVAAVTGFGITLVLIAVIYAVLNLWLAGQIKNMRNKAEETANTIAAAEWVAPSAVNVEKTDSTYKVKVGTVDVATGLTTANSKEVNIGYKITIDGTEYDIKFTSVKFTNSGDSDVLELTFEYQGHVATKTLNGALA